MSPLPPSPRAPRAGVADRLLSRAGLLWFLIAAVGQVAFIVFILGFYGTRTLAGDLAAFGDKPLIRGYVEGDSVGNGVFVAHVLLAAVVTLGGLIQLVPAVRRRVPGLHRWTGRTFIVISIFMALSGVWMSIARGAYLSLVSAVAIGGNGVLILIFATLAWRYAMRRDFDVHRVWAMRTFMVVSGVWFLRVGLMGWVVINRGPVGMNDSLSGPADIVLTFGSYLIPLVVLELYLAAGRSGNALFKGAVAALLLVAALYTAVGVFGTTMLMWGPYL